MFQLIAIALLGYIGFKFFSGLKKAGLAREQQSHFRRPPTQREDTSINTVRCARCGLHVAATDAVQGTTSPSTFYCCEEHARRG